MRGTGDTLLSSLSIKTKTSNQEARATSSGQTSPGQAGRGLGEAAEGLKCLTAPQPGPVAPRGATPLPRWDQPLPPCCLPWPLVPTSPSLKGSIQGSGHTTSALPLSPLKLSRITCSLCLSRQFPEDGSLHPRHLTQHMPAEPSSQEGEVAEDRTGTAGRESRPPRTQSPSLPHPLLTSHCQYGSPSCWVNSLAAQTLEKPEFSSLLSPLPGPPNPQTEGGPALESGTGTELLAPAYHAATADERPGSLGPLHPTSFPSRAVQHRPHSHPSPALTTRHTGDPSGDPPGTQASVFCLWSPGTRWPDLACLALPPTGPRNTLTRRFRPRLRP